MHTALITSGAACGRGPPQPEAGLEMRPRGNEVNGPAVLSEPTLGSTTEFQVWRISVRHAFPEHHPRTGSPAGRGPPTQLRLSPCPRLPLSCVPQRVHGTQHCQCPRPALTVFVLQSWSVHFQALQGREGESSEAKSNPGHSDTPTRPGARVSDRASSRASCAAPAAGATQPTQWKCALRMSDVKTRLQYILRILCKACSRLPPLLTFP